jgi:CheY-like chemotaxis protein
MQVLFIDDDFEDFEIFCEASQTIGKHIDCIFKQNGSEGLRYLQHASVLPDFIFLDINMPVMDGVECLKQIKLSPKLKRIPVIIFSTAINPRIDYRRMGATAVVVKPTTYQELVERLRSILK